MTEHDARIMGPKAKAVKDRDALRDYAESHFWCAACGSERTARHLHHIIGGRGGRSDEACNLISVCFDPCHPFCDLASNLGVVLSFKMRADGVTVWKMVAERLSILHGRALPSPQPIPEYFVSLYRRNRQGDYDEWRKTHGNADVSEEGHTDAK